MRLPISYLYFFFRRYDFLFILLLKYTHNKSQSKFKCVLLCWYRILSHSQLLLSGLDYWLSRYWPPIQNLSWRAQFFFDQYSSNVFGFTWFRNFGKQTMVNCKNNWNNNWNTDDIWEEDMQLSSGVGTLTLSFFNFNFFYIESITSFLFVLIYLRANLFLLSLRFAGTSR